MYSKGLDRIGCWLCPACELAEFHLVEQLHPELWNKWNNFLVKYAEKKGFPQEWIKYGWWRWKRLPGDQKRFIEQLGFEPSEIEEKNQKIEYIRELKKEDNSIVAYFSIPIDLKKVEALLPIYVDKYTLRENRIEFTLPQGNKVTICKNSIEVELESQEDFIKDFANIVYIVSRAVLCSKCYSCVNWCPSNAIVYDPKINGFRVLSEKCSKCKICNKECPTVRYIADNMIAALESLITFYTAEV